MTKKETTLAAVRSSEFYVEIRGEWDNLQNTKEELAQAIRFAIDSGIKGAYTAAFQAGVDSIVAKGGNQKHPAHAVRYIMELAGIKAPGKNGKRGKKAEEPVTATLEAWVACYHSADWSMAAKIAKQLKAQA